MAVFEDGQIQSDFKAHLHEGLKNGTALETVPQA
jgi:hypothetical protein